MAPGSSDSTSQPAEGMATRVDSPQHPHFHLKPLKPLKEFRLPDLKPIFLEAFDQWNKHNDTRLGASLAFYALLSLAPLMLVLVSIAGLIFGHSAAQHQMVNEIQSLGGPTAGKSVAAFLAGSRDTSKGILATLFGFVTLIFSASGVVIELRETLNLIWGVPVPDTSGWQMIKSFIKERLFSFAIVLAIGFLLIVSLVLSTWVTAIGEFSASLFPGESVLLHIANFVFSFVVLTLLFAAIYKVMPDVHLEWRDVIFGGAVTSILFTVGKFLLGVYLGRASYGSMYGAAASIVLLIVWMYYSAQIFFLGAEFTKVFAARYGSRRHIRARTATAR